LLAMLFVILVAAELFTNALEHLGARLKISEGVTGSLFAAVGTALPETMVPVLAVFGGTSNVEINQEIGVGSILGAPLMLSTLSTCLMGIAVLRARGLRGRVMPERVGFVRDLNFFLIAFGLAAAAMYVPSGARAVRIVLSGSLLAIYVVYVFLTLRASNQLVIDGHATSAEEKMFLSAPRDSSAVSKACPSCCTYQRCCCRC
jgi:cation:H+ antiporter